MNIQASSLSFKGKYLVHGNSNDVNKVEQIVSKETNGNLSTYKLKSANNQTVGIFATNEDAVYLSYAKKNKMDKLIPETKKCLKGNLMNMLSSVFGTGKDVKSINVLNAKDVIDSYNQVYGPSFIADKGITTDKQVLHIDGSVSLHYDKGQTAKITYPNGAEIRYYSDGMKESEKLEDGTVKTYFDSGFIKSIETPEGRKRVYYSNGKIKLDKTSDGVTTEFYPNGKIKREIKLGGEETIYDELGNVREVRHSPKMEEDNISGSVDYYPNGQVKIAIVNGEVHSYFENGNIQGIVKPDGTTTMFNQKGFITVMKDKEGCIRSFSYGRNDMLIQERYSDGTVIDYRNGQRLRETKKDRSSIEYYPYNADTKDINPRIPGYTTKHGSIKSIKLPDGSFRKYNEKGVLIMKKNPDTYISVPNICAKSA